MMTIITVRFSLDFFGATTKDKNDLFLWRVRVRVRVRVKG